MQNINPSNVAFMVFERIKTKFGDPSETNNPKEYELCDYIIGNI
jgi:hypothetical protein